MAGVYLSPDLSLHSLFELCCGCASFSLACVWLQTFLVRTSAHGVTCFGPILLLHTYLMVTGLDMTLPDIAGRVNFSRAHANLSCSIS